MRMFIKLALGSTLVVGALSLGLSFAHALETPPRLRKWPLELWRETTVTNDQYRWFGVVGGPLEVLAVVLALVLASIDWATPRSPLSAASGLLFLLALIVWLSVVRRANLVMATWRNGAEPPDPSALRVRWERRHVIMAALKLIAFGCLAVRASIFQAGL